MEKMEHKNGKCPNLGGPKNGIGRMKNGTKYGISHFRNHSRMLRRNVSIHHVGVVIDVQVGIVERNNELAAKLGNWCIDWAWAVTRQEKQACGRTSMARRWGHP